MFITKKKFRKLEREIERLKNTNSGLSKRVWELENPQKFSPNNRVSVEYEARHRNVEYSGIIVSSKIDRNYFGQRRRYYSILKEDGSQGYCEERHIRLQGDK